ncbi:hypothetical protein QQ045_030045 [Rhodiola kirilowii]
MAGSGQARPPDTHQKVVLHPQVGGRASGTTSTAVDPTFPPLLNTFTPVLPEGNRTQKRTFGEALELLEDAGHIRQPDPSNSRLKEPAGPTNNKSWTASGRTFASAAEDGDRSVPLGKGRTTQAIDDKDVEWTVVRKRKGKQRSMHKEQRQQVSQDVNKNRKSSARGKTEQAMAPQRITCHLKKSCSLGDLSKADLSKAGTILKDKNGPQNTAHLEKDLTKLGPDRESQPIRREDMDQVDVVNDIGQQMADPTDEALNGENGNGSSGDPTDEALNEENENGWTDSDPGLASARQIAKENEIISHSENNENEIAHQISSLGNASFYCEDLGGWVRPRAFYTYLRASCEDDDSIILHAMTERVNGNRQAQQEGSGTIEESNHEVAHNSANDLGDQEVSVVPPPVPTKSRHRKKKATRSSSRACPKKKDTNFVW